MLHQCHALRLLESFYLVLASTMSTYLLVFFSKFLTFLFFKISSKPPNHDFLNFLLLLPHLFILSVYSEHFSFVQLPYWPNLSLVSPTCLSPPFPLYSTSYIFLLNFPKLMSIGWSIFISPSSFTSFKVIHCLYLVLTHLSVSICLKNFFTPHCIIHIHWRSLGSELIILYGKP